MFVQTRIRFVIMIAVIVVLAATGCSRSSEPSAADQTINSEQQAALAKMNGHAAAMFRYAKQDKYPEALGELEAFTEMMTKLTYNGVTSAEGLNALTSLVADTREIYRKVKSNKKEMLVAAAKLQLAADALGHKEKPMWLDYRKSFKESAELLKSAIHDKNYVEALSKLRIFHEQYLIIKPAVHISRDAALVEKLDSWFLFMNGLLTQTEVNDQLAHEGAAHTTTLINELFRDGDMATTVVPLAERPPILWASMLAGAIVAVLFYVGYKKYKFMSGRM